MRLLVLRSHYICSASNEINIYTWDAGEIECIEIILDYTDLPSVSILALNIKRSIGHDMRLTKLEAVQFRHFQWSAAYSGEWQMKIEEKG